MSAAPSKPPKKQKFLPLREITINSRPLVKHAIQFSCDGDLAVTADDSVHVFVPEFPDFSKRRARIQAELNGEEFEPPTNDDDGAESSSSDEDDDAPGPRRYNHQTFRAQYSEGSKHMPVSYPPLDPRVNRELFLAADLPFPYEQLAAAGRIGDAASGDDEEEDSDGGNSEPPYDDASDSDGEEVPGLGGFNRPYGAGYGPITGVGSSMNHVVAISWSPSGLGVNRRPILAVLTGAGTVAMFGDGSEFANILPRANDSMLQRRELNSWVVLWGVGERLIVPGQQTEVSEYLKGFAWAREIAPGQGLLATVNDVNEVAIISVQLVFVPEEGKGKGEGPTKMGTKETVVWLVREVARFKVEGPHGASNPMDPDYVPCGTSFGLKWGPWLQNDDSRTSVLSYIDRNHVGFRKITLKDSWVRGELPTLNIEKEDTYGMCLNLSVDAFVEFEDGIWHHGDNRSCRGLIATGFDVKAFDVILSGGPNYQQKKHSVWECGTAYREDNGQGSQNPIIDLVIHPPDLSNPTPVPLYTLIRMSATPTTKDWFQTNVPPPADPAADSRPQWVRTIAQKLEVQVPIDMHLTRRYGDDSDSDGSGSGSDDDSEMDMDDGLDTLADEETDEAATIEVPEIHPHRFRLHGLTLSSGGGISAVLASSHSTQHPERGGWHTVRSNVLFGYKPRRKETSQDTQSLEQQQDDYGMPIDPQFSNMATAVPADPPAESHYTHLTTEARLFESLYGAGPEVPAVHYPSAPRLNTHQLFTPALASQKCDLCGSPMNVRKGDLSGCVRGHFFGTCATSGLAVQTPGGTRSCGACGLRTMRAEVLVGKMPVEKREEVRRVVEEGVCGACGGKFLS